MNTSADSELVPRLVGDISGRFFVPSYQRGYRWGQHEVTQLLNDIEQADGRYFLQPVVVKSSGDRWELIDGQQRLTTLLLILRYIRRHLPTAAINYALEYETREQSSSYLEDPVEERSQENIDFFHIFEAAQCVAQWFDAKADPALAAVDFYQALSKRVYVIWYQAPDEVDSRTLFTRLNIGRIPLTDAELVKAVLLAKSSRPHEIAAQWDSIERDLRATEVWSFITGSATQQPTHISLLLDIVAGGPQGSARPMFHTFESLRARIQAESPDEVWNDVVDLHSLVIGWYEDRDLFHKVGFLVATGVALAELIQPARTLTRNQFLGLLDWRIGQRVGVSRSGLGDLSYERDPSKCERLLLLMNVETVRRRHRSSERYSFASHAARAWSLEHIAAQSAERLNRADQWSEWLRLHRDALSGIPALAANARSDLVGRINEAMVDVTEHKFRLLEAEIIAIFDGPVEGAADSVHSITNLALLAGSDNSALSNACFEVKRREILRMDRDGRYIPPATRNVFLKYLHRSRRATDPLLGPP